MTAPEAQKGGSRAQWDSVLGGVPDESVKELGFELSSATVLSHR